MELTVTATVTANGGMHTGRQTVGCAGAGKSLDEAAAAGAAEAAADRALVKVAAIAAPSGPMPVVLRHGSAGVLFHEACGHGLEADRIAKGASVYAGRLGEILASGTVDLIDDGTLDGGWGTSAIDDEGTPTTTTALVRQGQLVGSIADRLAATAIGGPSTGNGRRESYRHLPDVRMTNTLIARGADDADSLVEDTSHGVYLAHLRGGQVDPATGVFVFGTSEAYLIERGRITAPLRDTTLVGDSLTVLAGIDGVADDFEMAAGGRCGKGHQSVPVGFGCPTVRVRAMTVGG